MNKGQQTEIVRPRARLGTMQAEKADETHRQLLEAAVFCLAETGFANTTMTSISRRAGISRGAMQYHFENMKDVLGATADFIQNTRLARLVSPSDDLKGHENDADRFVQRVDVLWEFLTSPTNIAFFELSVASRNDGALAQILGPANERFWQVWMRVALDTYPEWRGREREMELACSLAQTLLEGLAVREMTHRADDAIGKALRGYLADRILDIFELGDRNTPTGEHRITRAV